MTSQVILKITSVAVLLIAGAIISSADVSHLSVPQANSNDLPVTDICLGCICEASSGCNQTLKCDGQVCGLFRITWPYWSDAGKPTLQGEAVDSPTAYANCANDVYCAASCVQGYMRKFGQDCNADGKINCIDYAAIHKHGGYGCSGPLPLDYQTKFDTCLNNVINNQG